MSDSLEPNLEADVLAATLHQGLQESQDLLEFLARKFEGPLSQLLTVRRKGGCSRKNIRSRRSPYASKDAISRSSGNREAFSYRRF